MRNAEVNFTLVCEELSGDKGSSASIQVFIRDANDNVRDYADTLIDHKYLLLITF
jgi:hypothetical protein